MSKLRSPLSRLLVLACIAGTAAAQSTRVWPSAYATRSGEGAQNAPFTVTASNPVRQTRSMTTMSAASLPFGTGSVLNQIAYRRDARYRSASYGATSGGRLVVEIGTIARADRPETAFGRNWNAQPLRVFDGAFDVPAAGPPGSGPAPFNVTIPFSQSWTYPGGDMAVDLVFAGSTAGPWRRDAALVPVQTNAAFWQVGQGCRGSNGFAPYTWPRVEDGVPGKTIVLELTGAARPASSASLENYAVNILGALITTFEGVPLPLDLGLLGFPQGCMLRTDIFAVQIVRTGNPSTLFTRAEASWPIPSERSLTGGMFFTQWFCNDTAVSSQFKMTASSACAISVGAADANPRALAGSTVWRYGSAGGSTEAGNVAEAEYVAVTRFGGTLR